MTGVQAANIIAAMRRLSTICLALFGIAITAAAEARPYRALAPVTASGSVAGVAACPRAGDDNAPLLKRDPHRGRHYVISYLTGDARAAVVASSESRGARWSRRTVPGLTPCTGGPAGRVVDQGLLVDRDGHTIVSSGWVADGAGPTTVGHEGAREYVSTAPDDGSFGKPIDLERSPDERGYMTEQDGAVFLETEGFAYLGGTFLPGFGSLSIMRSSDHGASWTELTPPATFVVGRQPLATGLVTSGSALVAFWLDVDAVGGLAASFTGAPVSGSMWAARSVDDGASWSQPSKVAECANCTLPDTTVAPDGSLLMSFEDATSGKLVLMSSPDGRSWSRHALAPASGIGWGDTAVATRRDGTIGVLHLRAANATRTRYDVVLATAATPDGPWMSTTVDRTFSLGAIDYETWDSPLGASQDLLAVPGGFLAAYTATGGPGLVDGKSDIRVARIAD